MERKTQKKEKSVTEKTLRKTQKKKNCTGTRSTSGARRP